MSAAQNESRKRGKKRYVSGQQGKRWKGSRELEVGMQGILITCNMNERKCTAEAFNLLNDYADKLYGPEKLHDNKGNNSSSEEDEAEEEEDVDVALKKEVAQLQSSRRKQERRFQALDSGANNVIFIKTHNLEPDKLIHHILSDLHTTKKKKSRVILRMLPVTGTCKAFQEDMLKYLTTFLEPWFKTPNSATYQIAFKARNSSHNKREEIIKSIASLVGKLNPKNKVDLTNPELTIIVEVIKSVCCVSVARDYTLYRKYNVQEVVKEDAPKADAAKTRTEPNAAEQKDEHNGGEAEEKKVAAEEKEEEEKKKVAAEEEEEEKKVAAEEEEEKNEAENEEGVNEGEGGGE
ncbi:THUMP domain-containing protein 1 isoform X1 [Fundulus heteroclitus]|uniref:THUMP domain-containing protein 1 isoform X1 n=1 Tax=Fundulus heteroclitus TaxID=8078 RepID=UPI00165C0ADC|nr:THUMP domain-containing protein 1 isoform X1 [Fundulus heteroclitus]